jgi:hypothetical protein
MEMIEEAQTLAGYFDEGLIWADFDKIQEIRLTDFIYAVLNQKDQKVVGLLDLLLNSMKG